MSVMLYRSGLMFAAKYDALDFCLALVADWLDSLHQVPIVSHSFELYTLTALEAKDNLVRKNLLSTIIYLMCVRPSNCAKSETTETKRWKRDYIKMTVHYAHESDPNPCLR